METEKICPSCGRTYTDHPALSRRDNHTEICPDCGMKEALQDASSAMTKERALSILRNVVDYVSTAENTKTQILLLSCMGFEEEDLIYFGYSAHDIDDAREK